MTAGSKFLHTFESKGVIQHYYPSRAGRKDKWATGQVSILPCPLMPPMAVMAPATVQPSLSSASPLWEKRCWSLGGETIKTKGDSTVTGDVKPLQNDQCEDLADSPHWTLAHSVCRNTARWRSPCTIGRGVGDRVSKEQAEVIKQKDS